MQYKPHAPNASVNNSQKRPISYFHRRGDRDRRRSSSRGRTEEHVNGSAIPFSPPPRSSIISYSNECGNTDEIKAVRDSLKTARDYVQNWATDNGFKMSVKRTRFSKNASCEMTCSLGGQSHRSTTAYAQYESKESIAPSSSP